MKILKTFRMRNLDAIYRLYRLGDIFIFLLMDCNNLHIIGSYKKASTALRHFNRAKREIARQNNTKLYLKPVHIAMTYSEAMAEMNSLERE